MKSKNLCPNNFYDVMMLLVGIITLAIVATVFVAVILGGFGVIKDNNKTTSTELFALIPVVFSTMVILVVPKYLVQNECNAYFKNKGYDIYLQEYFATKNEINKVDAHLSRMISVYLHDNYPVWAIGWAFRSLKRYERLPNETVKTYSDFYNFINQIITMCHSKIIDAIADTGNGIKEGAVNNLITKSTPVLGDEIRVVERAVKDIIDYIIYGKILKKQNNQEESYQSILAVLTLVLYEYNGTIPADYNDFEDLANRICEISDYTIEEKKHKKTFFHDEIEKYFTDFDQKMRRDTNSCIRCIINKETASGNNDVPKFNPKMHKDILRDYKNVELM